ncbi:MAG TPA: DNA double-strand break repair nuclease NurA, partial [Actinomycetota bacterium]|nr:DNA double-strand break repair nuclease NurA [Actinomycetota bacterium]
EGQLELGDDVVVEGHPDRFDLVPLSPTPPGTVWAVDGGSCTLADGRSFQVAATRAARVRFRDGVTDLVEAPPLEVRALTADEAARLYRDRLARMDAPEPDEPPRIPRPIDVLRECDEWDLVRRTVAEAERDDVVLVDGSLHGGPLVPAEVIRAIHREAVDRGVHLAGVVKASTLFWGRNAPLVGLLKRRGDRELGRTPWAARISTDPVFRRLYVGEIFVARLAATASHAFRVDVAHGPGPPKEVLARLAGCSDDAAFVGYPYPLARAHRAARVSGYAVADLRRAFRTALAGAGMDEEEIETLFQDFHEVLNRS